MWWGIGKRRVETYIELNTKRIYQYPNPQAHPERKPRSRANFSLVARYRPLDDNEHV
jgi:hypothetical protein